MGFFIFFLFLLNTSMKFVLLALFVFKADVDVGIDIQESSMVVHYPNNACFYEATVFRNDGDDLIVTNVKCDSAYDCQQVGYNCLPYTLEDIAEPEDNYEDLCGFEAFIDDDYTVTCFSVDTPEVSSPGDDSSHSWQLIPFIGLLFN